MHEKAPTQRSHEPTPAALLSSRKSIPIPGLHARVQRESRTKVCWYNESLFLDFSFATVVRYF